MRQTSAKPLVAPDLALRRQACGQSLDRKPQTTALSHLPLYRQAVSNAAHGAGACGSTTAVASASAPTGPSDTLRTCIAETHGNGTVILDARSFTRPRASAKIQLSCASGKPSGRDDGSQNESTVSLASAVELSDEPSTGSSESLYLAGNLQPSTCKHSIRTRAASQHAQQFRGPAVLATSAEAQAEHTSASTQHERHSGSCQQVLPDASGLNVIDTPASSEHATGQPEARYRTRWAAKHADKRATPSAAGLPAEDARIESEQGGAHSADWANDSMPSGVSESPVSADPPQLGRSTSSHAAVPRETSQIASDYSMAACRPALAATCREDLSLPSGAVAHGMPHPMGHPNIVRAAQVNQTAAGACHGVPTGDSGLKAHPQQQQQHQGLMNCKMRQQLPGTTVAASEAAGGRRSIVLAAASRQLKARWHESLRRSSRKADGPCVTRADESPISTEDDASATGLLSQGPNSDCIPREMAVHAHDSPAASQLHNPPSCNSADIHSQLPSGTACPSGEGRPTTRSCLIQDSGGGECLKPDADSAPATASARRTRAVSMQSRTAARTEENMTQHAGEHSPEVEPSLVSLRQSGRLVDAAISKPHARQDGHAPAGLRPSKQVPCCAVQNTP